MTKRKEIHVVPNSDRGGWDAKTTMQNEPPSILRENKMQWTGRDKRHVMMAPN